MRLWARLDAQRFDFGTPLALSWDQNGAQNRPSGANNLKFMKSRSAFFSNLKPTCSQGRFRSAPWHNFGRFCMDFKRILMDCCIIVEAFRTVLCNKICRLPTSPDTKRIDSKHQEHADICRDMKSQMQTKNADTKT